MHKDAVCTSLTKLFNGRGDAMAGSVILSERYLRENGGISEQTLCGEEELFCSDASAVFANSEVRHCISFFSDNIFEYFFSGLISNIYSLPHTIIHSVSYSLGLSSKIASNKPNH